ncbi:MAG: PepSY-associated TM helix domain-containing protein [Methylocystis sp.]
MTSVIRALFVRLHRWAGLAMAGFLIVVGLTGSLLAFWLEVNQWLTPELYPGARAGKALGAATLARRAESLAPEARVDRVYLGYAGTVIVGVSPRSSDASLPFNQIFLDPIDGHELGRRKIGGLPAHVNQIMPFVYQLHMYLAMGNIGEWILGIVALLWTLDCFIGFYLTLPVGGERSRKSFVARWKPSWLVKFKSSFYRVNFDLHRAAGLWLSAMLFVFAWSSVSFKMPNFYTRATQLVLDYETPVWAQAGTPPNDVRAPMQWEAAQETGERLMEEQARQHGFAVERPLALYHLRAKSLYEYRVRSSRDIGDKAGSTSILFDSRSGALKRISLPTGHRNGTTLTTWLVELHMANLFGLPYRVFVCAMGLVIAMLSVTGVYIWWKKRKARRYRERIRGGAEAGVPAE